MGVDSAVMCYTRMVVNGGKDADGVIEIQLAARRHGEQPEHVHTKPKVVVVAVAVAHICARCARWVGSLARLGWLCGTSWWWRAAAAADHTNLTAY
jgi:hypothetical protein